MHDFIVMPYIKLVHGTEHLVVWLNYPPFYLLSWLHIILLNEIISRLHLPWSSNAHWLFHTHFSWSVSCLVNSVTASGGSRRASLVCTPKRMQILWHIKCPKWPHPHLMPPMGNLDLSLTCCTWLYYLPLACIACRNS